MASSTSEIPPAGLIPIIIPVLSKYSLMVSSIIIKASIVAAGWIFPVEVLMKSAPASIDNSLAFLMFCTVPSSPVSNITFR